MAKILIAEDSPTTLAWMKQSLAPLGHTLLSATDGEEAVLLLKNDLPDLVILDVLMPKINGFEICRSIRADPKTKNTPVIIVTALTRESDRFWGQKQGADEYLAKPITAQQLQETIRHYLH